MLNPMCRSLSGCGAKRGCWELFHDPDEFCSKVLGYLGVKSCFVLFRRLAGLPPLGGCIAKNATVVAK